MSAKEHGLSFTGDTVRAILNGRKTQTRRPVTPHNSVAEFGDGVLTRAGWKWIRLSEAVSKVDHFQVPFGDNSSPAVIRPRIRPGDSIWVRETWRIMQYGYRYKADRECLSDVGLWSPSIHMPRDACRIVLPVIRVHSERLNDITAWGAITEGIEIPESVCNWTPCSEFLRLWDAMYGDKYPASSNPPMWVYEWDKAEVKQ